MNTGATRAARDIQLIHIAKAQVGMDDETYRALLRDRFGVASSKDLQGWQRQQLLDHFARLGFAVKKPENEWSFIKRAPQTKQPLLRKICAICIDLGVGKAYAEGAAKRQHGIERHLEMMSESELWLLAGVLQRTRKYKQRAGDAAVEYPTRAEMREQGV